MLIPHTFRTRRILLPTAVALVLLCAVVAVAQTPDPAIDPAKAELQSQIESGSGLTSRGRKILFRARTHQDAGRFAEATKILAEWLDAKPERENPLLRFQLAMAHLGLEEKDAAIVALQAAVAREPRFARAWLRLGEIAYDLQRHELAADAFVQGYELSPEQRPEFLYYGCVASLMGGRSERAQDDLERLLTNHRSVATLDWYRALVAAAADAEQTDRAEPYLQKALADHAEEPEFWELAYRFAAGREDYEGAVVYLTITGYLRELSRDERIRLGDLYAVINVPLEAARSYAAALESASGPVGRDVENRAVRSDQVVEYERLVSAWMAAHRHEEARTVLRQALAKNESRKLWAMLGDLEHLAEDYTAALEAYGRGCALDPAFGRGWLMMGYCCQELGRPDEARAHLQKAAAFPEQSASARILLAE